MIAFQPWFCRVAGHVWRGNLKELKLPTAHPDSDDTYIAHTICLRCGKHDKIHLHAAAGVASSLEAIDGDTTL
jgi:hypothetical protein